jgi:15-hydroxyprostaglandin dehydrogenase (NAD)
MPTDAPPVALITGAAAGLGLALTKHLVAKGWKVGMCDINGLLGDKEASAINDDTSNTHLSSNDRVFFRRVDITDYTAQAAFFREVFEWGGGRIDYFAANAGIAEKDSLFKRADRMAVDGDGLPKRLAQQTLDVNVKAIVDGVWLYRFFAARRRDGKKGGKITVTASSSGFYPYKWFPLYVASKHAMVGLVRSAAPSMEPEGIAINAVCPSFVKTSLLPGLMLDRWPQEYLTPMKTVLQAHDAFLEGEHTGQTVETSADKLYWRKHIEYPDESARWIAEDAEEHWKRLKGAPSSKL